MLKQSSFLLLFSVLCVLFASQFSFFLHAITRIHDYLGNGLGLIFSGSHLGLFFKETISLLAIPLLVAMVPGGIYWAIKRKTMPYLIPVIWVAWIMLATTLTIENKITTDSDFVGSGTNFVHSTN